MVCEPETCSAHKFVLQIIEDIKEDKRKMEDHHRNLTENVIKITENLLELQRSGLRTEGVLQELRLYNASQDTKIDKTTVFMWKAVGVVAAVTFMAMIFPTILSFLKYTPVIE